MTLIVSEMLQRPTLVANSAWYASITTFNAQTLTATSNIQLHLTTTSDSQFRQSPQWPTSITNYIDYLQQLNLMTKTNLANTKKKCGFEVFAQTQSLLPKPNLLKFKVSHDLIICKRLTKYEHNIYFLVKYICLKIWK